MRPPTDDYIQVYSGEKFNFSEPKPEQILITDVAHSLAMQCRYNGHCEYYYSVAEHSVLVARWLFNKYGSRQLAMEGLLHDASEAYLCDIPRPIKPHLDPHYGNLEYGIERAVAEKFNLKWPWDERVKEADMRICLDEYKMLFEKRLGACQWTIPHTDPLGVKIQCLNPSPAKNIFLNAYYAYREE